MAFASPFFFSFSLPNPSPKREFDWPNNEPPTIGFESLGSAFPKSVDPPYLRKLSVFYLPPNSPVPDWFANREPLLFPKRLVPPILAVLPNSPDPAFGSAVEFPNKPPFVGALVLPKRLPLVGAAPNKLPAGLEAPLSVFSLLSSTFALAALAPRGANNLKPPAA